MGETTMGRSAGAPGSVPAEDRLDGIIHQMKSLAGTLVPHSFPKRKAEDEEIISLLKTREETIDGYDVVLYYGVSDYSNHQMETFQVYGQETPFLPFYLVCKLARRFLGDRDLALVDIYVNNKKLYIWTLTRDPKGQPKAPVEDLIPEDFEGFRFSRMKPSQVNFL